MAKAEPCSITRRSLVAAFALPVFGVRPAAALTGPADEPDPIFALIAQHRRAYDDVIAVIDTQARAEEALRAATRAMRRTCKQRLSELIAAEGELGRKEMDLTARFIATVPETLRGAAAALAYVREHFAQGYPLCEEDSYMTLIASTEQAICRAAGLPPPR